MSHPYPNKTSLVKHKVLTAHATMMALTMRMVVMVITRRREDHLKALLETT